MLGTFGEPDTRLFLIRTVLPIFLAAALVSLGSYALVVWATAEADRASAARQHGLVELIVSQLQDRISHDQESVTVWDDAVNAVRDPDGAEWIDTNLGAWMATYFGHDHAYVLNPSDKPIYAFADGSLAEESRFLSLARNVRPLVAELRSRLRAGDTEGIADRVLSIGVSDLSLIDRRPAIVSVKPIVSDSGELIQTPGAEYLHVAVRFLDESFIAELTRDYLLEGLRFDHALTASSDEAGIKLTSSKGETIGYFIWQPYRPGSVVLRRVSPVLMALSIVGLGAMALLVGALRRRSLRLSLSEATVRHLAHHDVLTGLPNRTQFNAKLEAALVATRRPDNCIALLYLDLDRFKQVNDTFGHPSGDELLSEFADRLRRLTQEGDIVARIGGDEFTIIIRDVQSVVAIQDLCERLIETARHPFDIAGTRVFVGVSVGVAFGKGPLLDRVEITRRADVALYQAKRSGRSAFAIYAEDMDSDINARRDVERDLRAALETGGQLQLYYQPLFSARSSRVTGVEALLRWKHPERGNVPPDVFIPLAEETGLIERLDNWVLQEACKTAGSWPIDTVAVNISIHDLRNPGFAVKVANILMASGMSPSRLELEVTESAMVDQAGECQRNVEALRELGVRFALDDFGIGFSSLSRLQLFDVDRIKIDRSFVHGFGRDSGDEAIVQAIIDLARAKGVKTTAEGIETTTQRVYLQAAGCDDFQGFLFSPPQPASEIEKLWQHGNALALPA